MKSPNTTAHVVGSAIVVFLPGDVTDQNREDVCNSIEFSERATRRKFPEPEHMGQWEDTFSSSLSAIHWFLQSSDVSGKYIEFFDLLKAVELSETERKSVEGAIRALTSRDENSSAFELFNERITMDQSLSEVSQTSNPQTVTHRGYQIQARYMIVICVVKNGAVAARFISCQSVGPIFPSDFLFPQFNRDAKIRMSIITRSLNVGTYADVRDQIEKKLADTGYSAQSKIVLPGSK